MGTCTGVSAWRAHVKPYDWDVRFLDASGNDIPDGSYFTDTVYVSLTNSVPGAVIYYTTDGTTPTRASRTYSYGTRIPVMDTTVLTACAVTNGVAIAVRSVTLNEGVEWSGEAGMNGSGVWADDESVMRHYDGRRYGHNAA